MFCFTLNSKPFVSSETFVLLYLLSCDDEIFERAAPYGRVSAQGIALVGGGAGAGVAIVGVYVECAATLGTLGIGLTLRHCEPYRRAHFVGTRQVIDHKIVHGILREKQTAVASAVHVGVGKVGGLAHVGGFDIPFALGRASYAVAVPVADGGKLEPDLAIRNTLIVDGVTSGRDERDE